MGRWRLLTLPFEKAATTREDDAALERLEGRLARELVAVWRREARRALAWLREDRTLSTEFWREYARTHEEVLVPWMQRVVELGVSGGRAALDAVRMEKAGAGVSIAWDLINEDVRAWALEYVFELITGITETTTARMQRAVSAWVESGEAVPELVERVLGIFVNPGRARLIAVTEATRVYAEANNRLWVSEGLPEAIFRPPAHPDCRCYLQPKQLTDGTWVVVWYTARDQFVDTDPHVTPWGVLAGCAAMHRRIVSGGTYSGMLLDEAEALASGRVM